MSVLANDLREAGLGLVSRARAWLAALRRTSPAVALLRLLIAGPLLGAWMIFVPVSPPVILFVGLALALAAALFPGTRAVGVALVSTGGAWLVTTTTLIIDVSLPVVLGLAAALYVAHAAAALAAVLPHDTAVAPAALGRWALRTVAVVVVSLGLGVAGLFVAAWLPPQPSLVAPVAGCLIAVGLACLMVWLVRRRSASGEAQR